MQDLIGKIHSSLAGIGFPAGGTCGTQSGEMTDEGGTLDSGKMGKRTLMNCFAQPRKNQ